MGAATASSGPPDTRGPVRRCPWYVAVKRLCSQGGSFWSGDQGNLNHAGRQGGAASVGERRKLASKTAEFHTAPNPLSSSCDSQEHARFGSSCKAPRANQLTYVPCVDAICEFINKTSPIYARWNSRVQANKMTFLVLVLSELIHGPTSVQCKLGGDLTPEQKSATRGVLTVNKKKIPSVRVSPYRVTDTEGPVSRIPYPVSRIPYLQPTLLPISAGLEAPPN